MLRILTKKTETTKEKLVYKELIYKELMYRVPMQVTTIIMYKPDYGFPQCPKCEVTIERDYQKFCDRCGQKLSWKHYSKAKIIDLSPPYKKKEAIPP